MANVLQTNKVDTQRDKLATELSWNFVSKVTNLQLPHLHLTYHTCIWCLRWGWPSSTFLWPPYIIGQAIYIFILWFLLLLLFLA